MQYWRKSNFNFSFLFNVIRRNLVRKVRFFVIYVKWRQAVVLLYDAKIVVCPNGRTQHITIVLCTWRTSTYYTQGVIILLERAYLHNRIRRNWCKFYRPKCATSQRDVTRYCALIGAYGPSGGGLNGNSSGIAGSPISLLSMVALEEFVGGA